MLRGPDMPQIWIIQPDERLRMRWASELRNDGMKVVEYASAEPALEALSKGGKAAVLVAEPASGKLTNGEFSEQARAWSPRLEIIFTPSGPEPDAAHAGAHVLLKPFEAGKLSRFIRLVAAKPALRSTLQRLFRQARSLHMDAARATP
jgi:DNA-binding NtrC family response regulator